MNISHSHGGEATSSLPALAMSLLSLLLLLTFFLVWNPDSFGLFSVWSGTLEFLVQRFSVRTAHPLSSVALSSCASLELGLCIPLLRLFICLKKYNGVARVPGSRLGAGPQPRGWLSRLPGGYTPEEGALLTRALLCCMWSLPLALGSSSSVWTMSFKGAAVTSQHMASSRF